MLLAGLGVGDKGVCAKALWQMDDDELKTFKEGQREDSKGDESPVYVSLQRRGR